MDIGTQVAVYSATIWTTILWILVLGAIGAVLFFVMTMAQYKHKFTVKKITGGKLIVIHDKAREIKNANGVSCLKLWKMKETSPMPPDEAILPAQKKSLFGGLSWSLEAYRTSTGTYTYIKDNLVDHIEELNTQIQKFELNKDPKGLKLAIEEKANFLESLQPLTTNDRQFYVNELAEAHRNKKKKMSEMILAATPIIAVVIILVSMIAFWGDITKPSIDMASKTNAAIEQLAIITEKQNNIILALSGKQVIEQDEETIPD